MHLARRAVSEYAAATTAEERDLAVAALGTHHRHGIVEGLIKLVLEARKPAPPDPSDLPVGDSAIYKHEGPARRARFDVRPI